VRSAADKKHSDRCLAEAGDASFGRRRARLEAEFPKLDLSFTTTNQSPTMTDSDSSPLSGIIIGLLSSFGSAFFVACIFLVVYLLKYTVPGRIILDRIGRPGEYDDEQAFIREEAEALETMDDTQRTEYMRAKGRLHHCTHALGDLGSFVFDLD
jgi:hypothetical protein